MSIMRVRFQINGTTGLPGLHTTYWTGASTNPVAADGLDVTARVRAFWNACITLLPNTVSVSSNVPIDVLDQITGDLTGQLPGGTVAIVNGTGTGELPRATMMLLRYGTNAVINRRRLQGRSFIGPCAQLTNTNGSVTPSSNTTLLTATAQLTTGPTASSLVVWHRPSDLFPAGGSTSPVTSFSTNAEFSVLRSRRD